MPVTRLSDVIVPEVYAGYMAKDTTDKTAIFESGIMRTDGSFGALLAGGGRTFNMPFWNDLDNTEANVASDAPDQKSVPRNVSASKDVAARQFRTQSWSTMDLTGVLAGSDPLARIRERTNAYWNRQFQSFLVATLTGVFADNAANDGGDMINDIGTDSGGAPTAAELVSAEAIIDTAYTAGDLSNIFTTIIVHPTVMKRLKKLNLIDFIPDSEGRIKFERYLGYMIVEDDGVRTVTGTNRTKYWSYLVGEGAISWAESPPPNAVAVERDESSGNGSGGETLYTRRQFLMHPNGIKWTDASVTGNFPSNADLATAANWDRVYSERKQIPIAALVTNG